MLVSFAMQSAVRLAVGAAEGICYSTCTMLMRGKIACHIFANLGRDATACHIRKSCSAVRHVCCLVQAVQAIWVSQTLADLDIEWSNMRCADYQAETAKVFAVHSTL